MSTSAAAAEQYYDSALQRGDYYTKEVGFWGGRGAEMLGLQGSTQRADFVALCRGQHPGTKETLTQRSKEDRRPGYDFCCAVPKSVSLYLAITDDKAVEAMIQDSFRETMDDIEARIECRVRKDGAQEDRTTGNLVYGCFTHRETRPVSGIPDPHYHIHAFVFNATYDQVEGVWKAGQFVNAKRNAAFYEAAFNARLATKLVEAGYGIRRTDRHFELASVGQELVEKFSKRTQLIEDFAKKNHVMLTAKARALMKETGMDFGDAFEVVRAEIGSRTRESKSAAVLTPDDQLSNWRAQMTTEEIASLGRETVMGARCQHLLDRPVAEEFSISHLFERVSVVRTLDAAALLLRRGIGQVKPEQAERWAGEDPRFIRPREKLLTTREVLSAEWAIVETARTGQDKFEELGRGGVWVMRNPAVALDQGQAAAVEHLLQSKDFAVSVRGPAGAGKTSMAQEAVQALEALSGRKVMMFSPSRAGVKELVKEGFQDADTLAKLRASSVLQKEIVGQILWIDEASFMSVKQMKWLFEFARGNGNRLILSGDTRQHHGVESGDALRILEWAGAVRQASLSKIFRQQVPALRSAMYELSHGRTEQGFDKLQAYGALHEVEDSAERLQAIATTHLRALREGNTSLIVAPTHAECRAVASVVRQAMRQDGLLTGEDQTITRLQRVNLTQSQKQDMTNYRAGQVVEFHARAKGGFKSGERWEVSRLSSEGVVVVKGGQEKLLSLTAAKNFEVYGQNRLELAAGDTVRITRNFRDEGHQFRNNELCTITAIDGDSITLGDGRAIKRSGALHIDQGIVVTSFASQGKTVDQLIASVPVDAFSQVNEAQFYVTMSRARQAMHLFTDCLPALREAVCRPSERLSGLELVGEQNYEEITKQVRLDARRMIELERRRGVERATPEIDRGMGMSR